MPDKIALKCIEKLRGKSQTLQNVRRTSQNMPFTLSKYKPQNYGQLFNDTSLIFSNQKIRETKTDENEVNRSFPNLNNKIEEKKNNEHIIIRRQIYSKYDNKVFGQSSINIDIK